MISLHQFYLPFLNLQTNELPEYIIQCTESWNRGCSPLVECKLWDDKSMIRLECQELYDAMLDPLGKVNIAKWEILYKYGGVFVDPDVFMVTPLSEMFLSSDPACSSFVSYKHELSFPGLLNANVVRFPAGHPMLKRMIEIMLMYDSSKINDVESWKSVGDGLLTRVYCEFQTGLPILFPSNFFAPVEYTKGYMYNGHGQVFALSIKDHVSVQGDGNMLLDTEENLDWTSVSDVADRFVHSKQLLNVENGDHPWCSLVILGGRDPELRLVNRWLELITRQQGGLLFGIEVVWIDDPATSLEKQKMLDVAFNKFIQSSRNTSLKLYRPSYSIRTAMEIERAYLKVAEMFPQRDLLLQFIASQHVDVLEDDMFIANQMDLDDENEDD